MAKLKMVFGVERRKKIVGIIQLLLGIIVLVISIGFFSSEGFKALPLFSFLVAIFMLLAARLTLLEE